MKVLIVTTQDRFFMSHVLERARYLKEMGCVVAIAAQKTSDDLVNKIRSQGFAFYDTKIVRQSLNPVSQFIAIVRLFTIQHNFKPDISYHLGAKSIFYGTLTAKVYNHKVGIVNAPIGLGYVYASNTRKAKFLRPIVLFLYKLFLNPKNSRVIIENLDDISYFIKMKCLKPKDAFCILGAGVDTEQYSPLPFEERNVVCTVIMASRLIKEKGVMDFVAAANELYADKVPVRMVLVGEPDYGNPSSITKEDYENIRRNPALECWGYRKDMSSVLKMGHICCLPSFYREGLPRILVEAASSGMAILTTDTIGCKETIREQNGYLFHVHDVKKLCMLIRHMVNNPTELRNMAERSRHVALSYFDSKIICKRTYDVIQTLL